MKKILALILSNDEIFQNAEQMNTITTLWSRAHVPLLFLGDLILFGGCPLGTPIDDVLARQTDLRSE